MRKQQFKKFSRFEDVKLERSTFTIPAFTLASSVWSGASIILAEFPVNNTEYFSLRTPIAAFGLNFVAAIRWTESGVNKRLKLFAHALDVLYYPVYDGERISASAVVEIWSVNTTAAPTLSAALALENSFLNFATDCSCEVTIPNTVLVQTTPSVLPYQAFGNPFVDPFLSP